MRKSCYDCELYCDECGGNARNEICDKFEEMSEYDKVELDSMCDEVFYDGMTEFEIFVHEETVKAMRRECGYCEEDGYDDESWGDEE